MSNRRTKAAFGTVVSIATALSELVSPAVLCCGDLPCVGAIFADRSGHSEGGTVPGL